MYIEEFHHLVDELNLSKKDNDDLKMIIECAKSIYTSNMTEDKITDTLIFSIGNCYIEQSMLLTQLGITVRPKIREYRYNDYKNSFSTNNSKLYEKNEQETFVIFPTSLFTYEKKDDILNKIKQKVK